jgi:transposase
MAKTTTRTHKVHDAETISAVLRDIGSGMSQQDAAKKNGVSGWTVSMWKKKGKLGSLPKGRITKAKIANAGKAAKASKAPKAPAKASKATGSSDLQAEVDVLRAALKALVPPAKLAAYKAKLAAEAQRATAAAAAL